MSPAYVTTLITVLLLLLLARVLLPLPVSRFARPLRRVEALLVVLGGVGLTFHCFAMFNTDFVSAVFGSGGVVGAVNALGAASIVLYVIPCVLLLAGLVRPHPVAAVVVAVGLVVVGITMYDGGPVQTHLRAIFTTVVIIAAVVATVVSGVGRHQEQTALSI